MPVGRWLHVIAAIALVGGAGVPLAGVEAQDHLPGDLAQGQGLANDVCAECHNVEPQGTGPSMVGAPAFQEVADLPSTTELSLRVFLRTPHRVMPDLILSPQETDDVISYILSLRSP